MANEAITWAGPPAVTDAVDPGQAYNMGREFTLTADASIVGVQWRVPDTAPAPVSGPHAIAIWDDVAGTRLAYKELTPTPGGYADLLFDVAQAGVTGTTYVASIYTSHYVYHSGDEAGATSPSGTIVAGTSRLAPFNGDPSSAPKPTSTTGLNFYVSPLISSGPEVHITAGTGTAYATATASITTRRTTATVAPAYATATAADTTGRITAGTGAAYATATAIRTTTRVTTGIAAAYATAYGSAAGPSVLGPWLNARYRSGVISSRNDATRIVSSGQAVE